MIDKNELRVGNHIWGVSDRIEQVNEILSVYVETSFRGGLLHYSSYEDISPIELTPDILLKCGFEKTVDVVGYSESEYIDYRMESFVLFYLPSGIVEIEFWNKGIETVNDRHYIGVVTHLHQLQNIYFALTGTELTFNQQ